MKKMTILSLMLALISAVAIGFTACGDEDRDKTYPVISAEGITANPIDCQVYKSGTIIPFHYIFTDDTELGAYNIEIHANSDHHSHSTSSAECEEDHDYEHEYLNPWVYNQDFTIPAGQRIYTARHDIIIPADIDGGDYHFMIRLTDRAGWQQLKSVAIKILPRDMTPPVITDEGITANPVNCQVYHRGEVIAFHYIFTDDQELSNYVIEIHSNFDHHSHSTEGDHDHECDDDEHGDDHHDEGTPWKATFTYEIPYQVKRFVARNDLKIPADATPGDYHFMIRVTDRAGWRQFKSVAIKILE